MAFKVLSSPTRALVVLGLFLPVVLVGIPAVLAHRAAADVKTSFSWVTHTLEVESAVRALLNTIIDTETGQRGYLLTHRENYLEPYDSGKTQVEKRLQDIRVLTSDNPYQLDRLREVKPLIDDRMALLAQSIELEQRDDHDGAKNISNSDRDKAIMDKIRGILQLMQNEEARLLGIRQRLFTQHMERSGKALLGLVGASACAALGILYLLYRLSRLQPLVKMCAWSRTIEFQGEWISFEEYLERRFNISTNHSISPAEMEKMRLAPETSDASQGSP